MPKTKPRPKPKTKPRPKPTRIDRLTAERIAEEAYCRAVHAQAEDVTFHRAMVNEIVELLYIAQQNGLHLLALDSRLRPNAPRAATNP
jgi:hypothetical protein